MRDFSRLIVGCGDLEALRQPDARLHGPSAQAAKVFYGKRTLISTFF